MHTPPSRLSLALAFGLATCAAAEAAPPAAAPPQVAVTWTDPEHFADVRENPGAGLAQPRPDEWLGDLSRYLQRRAARALAPGEHLDVTFTDVKRAGRYEPWRGPNWDDVRIVTDLYPPRIDLRFTLTGADGRTLREGERKLRDPAFLMNGLPNDQDPLRYEKRLLDDWLRREFPPAQASR